MKIILDMRLSETPSETQEYLKDALGFPDYYGKNLDALYDILTGLPHKGHRYVLTMPAADAPAEVRLYAKRILSVFQDAGVELVDHEGQRI